MTTPEKTVASIIAAFPRQKRFALAAMQALQSECGCVPRMSFPLLADHLGCSQAELYSVATFYKSLVVGDASHDATSTGNRLKADDSAIQASADGWDAHAFLVSLVGETAARDDDAGLIDRYIPDDENPFYANQTRVVLENVGVIDPSDIEEYREFRGFEGLSRALRMTPDEIIAQVEESGLRGKGGAGFPTGRKWRGAAACEAMPKYVICNCDEGEPGIFKDGAIVAGDPFRVIEGMTIAAIAIGAEEGFIYIRDGYRVAQSRMQAAIDTATRAGVLGEHVMGSDHRFTISVVRGAGSYVCGESTALMESIEGKPGEPRPYYVHSTEVGLFGQPTAINNVETLASVPNILRDGAKAFAGIGIEQSRGTKVFSMVGKVKHPGLVEVPLGTTFRTLIYDIGGGIRDGRPFKAAQTGGPSGGCIPESLLDLPIGFDTLKGTGAIMGSGGLIVMDDSCCMVQLARYYVDFLCDESCGRCAPCRLGLRQMRQILARICEGEGKPGDIELLERIGHAMADTSACGLGTAAPNTVLSTIRFFRDEFEAHISGRCCPAGACEMGETGGLCDTSHAVRRAGHTDGDDSAVEGRNA